VTGGWREVYNEELHNVYSSPSLIRIIKSKWWRWAGNLARMGVEKNAYRILVGKSEGKRPVGIPKRKRDDNIKMNPKETEWCDMD
jgi:hypothetical protein